MKLRWIIIFTIVILIVAASVFTLFQWKSSRLSTATVRRSSIKEAIYGIGTVVSRQHFTYKVSMMKSVEKVYVREGDRVKPGDPLIHMGDAGIVRSPIRGVVTFLPYSAGENTAPDSPIVMVQNLEDRYLKASLEQQSALQVKKGLHATLSFESLRGHILEGTVQSVFSKDSQFYAIIDVKDLPPQILPDMTADVAIQVAEKKDVLLVPVRALSAGFVTKLVGKNKSKVPITVGLADEEWAEILTGDLNEGDTLLLPGK